MNQYFNTFNVQYGIPANFFGRKNMDKCPSPSKCQKKLGNKGKNANHKIH